MAPVLDHNPDEYTRIRNKSGMRQEMRDPGLENGRGAIEPGAELLIPRAVYIRNAFRWTTWMVNVDTEQLRAAAAEALKEADESEITSEEAEAAKAAAEGRREATGEGGQPGGEGEPEAGPQQPPAEVTTEGTAPEETPPWTHEYDGRRARIVAVKNEPEKGEMVTAAIEGGPPRTMKRETWEENAKQLPADPPPPPETE